MLFLTFFIFPTLLFLKTLNSQCENNGNLETGRPAVADKTRATLAKRC